PQLFLVGSGPLDMAHLDEGNRRTPDTIPKAVPGVEPPARSAEPDSSPSPRYRCASGWSGVFRELPKAPGCATRTWGHLRRSTVPPPQGKAHTVRAGETNFPVLVDGHAVPAVVALPGEEGKSHVLTAAVVLLAADAEAGVEPAVCRQPGDREVGAAAVVR